jgi:hypothetical protein
LHCSRFLCDDFILQYFPKITPLPPLSQDPQPLQLW